MTLPNGVLVDRRPYPITTDFRAGLTMFSWAKSEQFTVENLINLWFPQEIPNNLEEALAAILRFYLRTETPETAPSSAPAAYDFLQDWDVILSGFQEKYGIDLTNPALNLHWWRFMALLEGLISPDLGQRAYLRTADLSEFDPQIRRKILQMRRKFAVNQPKETYQQHLDRLDEIIARGKEAPHGRRQHHS